MIQINRQKLKSLIKNEEQKFIAMHPKSKALFEKAQSSLLDGVPMPWMTEWASPFPIFIDKASGAGFVDVDGNNYIDFCLGDTGAMTGHAPEASVKEIRKAMTKGFTFMCPTEDSIWVGEEMARRFGIPYWQLAMTATDANRFCIRLARSVTKRPKILVFNYCYHGTVDEAQIILVDGVPTSRKSNTGAPVDPAITTRVVEFNDIDALEAALTPGDVALVLAEPAMTNIGIVHPDPGFHEAMREITRKTGTLLLIDETHTICCGPGGYTKANGLEPDILTIGKPIASGFPTAAYGFSNEMVDMIRANAPKKESSASDETGIGGTLAGNALAVAAIRATLQNTLTEETFAHTISLAKRFAEGISSVIDEFGLPWNVTRLGCRTEYWFSKTPARNGGEAAAAVDDELDQYMHLFSMNRNILMTPFHNMALIAPQTTESDVDTHTGIFRESVKTLLD
ncbi:MAG: aspartate aminotransferase family protein [Desulfobacterales bacterium]|nr:aspartate aminotransferase family protein [Desulfobacterales bacterium]